MCPQCEHVVAVEMCPDCGAEGSARRMDERFPPRVTETGGDGPELAVLPGALALVYQLMTTLSKDENGSVDLWGSGVRALDHLGIAGRTRDLVLRCWAVADRELGMLRALRMPDSK